jgi:hypothetical protein
MTIVFVGLPLMLRTISPMESLMAIVNITHIEIKRSILLQNPLDFFGKLKKVLNVINRVRLSSQCFASINPTTEVRRAGNNEINRLVGYFFQDL